MLVVVVLALRGHGDDGELRIVRGAPNAGFPLRGAGAKDEATIRSAADAWVRSARRGDDDWASDSNLDVTVLWAGPLSRDTDGVVLASGRSAAVLERFRGGDYWQIEEAAAGDADDPVIVTAAGAVLVRLRAKVSFLRSEKRNRQDPAVRQDDGLWHSGSSALPGGALLLQDGLPSRFVSARSDLPPAGVFLPGSVTAGVERSAVLRELSPRLLGRMNGDAPAQLPDPELADAALESTQRLVAAAIAAGASEGEDAPPQRPTSLPRLDLVGESILEPFGPVIVLSVVPSPLGSSRSDGRRLSLVAGAGGSAVAGRRDAVTAIPLGGASGGGLRAGDGPALGYGYVRREVRDEDSTLTPDKEKPRVQGPYLLVAGNADIAAVEVRAGRRTLRVPVPIGLIRADWLPDPDARERSTVDVAILGTTTAGAVAVPAGPETDMVAVQAWE